MTARQPFFDWLHSVDPTSKDVSLEEVNREPTVYLVPECESNDEFAEWLAQNFNVIFEEQLGGWWTDESAWPHNRKVDLFQRWFDCRLHSLVLDVGKVGQEKAVMLTCSAGFDEKELSSDPLRECE